MTWTPNPRITGAPLYHLSYISILFGSGGGTRTHDSNLMRVVRWPLLYSAIFGSHGRTRTCNSLINGQMLYQLNYARIYGGSMGNRTLNSAVTGRYFSQLNYRAIWWAGKDLNLWTVAGTVLQTACFNQTCIPTHMVTGTRFELVITTLKGWWLHRSPNPPFDWTIMQNM